MPVVACLDEFLRVKFANLAKLVQLANYYTT